ncbi:MAG: hypothetical protein HOO86_01855 [Bacteroidales bacterium]|nr:hypothetical protein [Bacteroidales bacterium]
MNWFFLILNLLYIQYIQSQDQELSLMIKANDIHVKNDTLYLKYDLYNKSKDKLVFYNINCAEFASERLTDSLLKIRTPLILINVYNDTKQLPDKIRSRTGPKDFSKYLTIINQYTIVGANEKMEFDIAVDVWPINLKKGKYKIQLKYYSNNYYDRSFNEANKTDNRIKNSLMFKGILKSNICTFIYDE